jgi:hypothetical protein
MVIVAPGVSAAERESDAQLTQSQRRGLEIFSEMDRRNSGFNDFDVNLTMILRTKSGKSSQRELAISVLEVAEDGDKIMVVFNTPASIRGTALLSHAHRVGVDDQWLFLPALKRVKKIAARNKSGPFVGSEFSFEDLSAQELTKYSYEYLRDETIEGQSFFVVARFALDEYSGYMREVFWLDQSEYRTFKVEYYDHEPEPLKVLSVADYEQYEQRFWKPHLMQMRYLRSQKSTDLEWGDYQFNRGLTADRDFSVASLRRAR